MLLLVYSVTLLAAVLVSERAHRTVLSTAVLFLVVGTGLGLADGAVEQSSVRTIAGELSFGVALGLVVPWLAVRLERLAAFGASPAYRRIGVLAVGLLVYALSATTHANEFLAAFTAGATLATVAPRSPATFAELGETGSELLKLAALLVFGSTLSPAIIRGLPWGGWVFALVALLIVRPLALALALSGSPLSLREKVVAGWFGPKGFASVVYGLLIVSSGIPRAEDLFHLVAITTTISIVLHSSTDVPVARWFDEGPGSAELPNRSEERA